MTTFDTLPCPVMVTDEAGRILTANRQMLDLVGGAQGTWAGQSMETFFPRASQIFLQTHVWPMLLREGNVREIYLRILDSEKQRIPIMVNCQKDNSGTFNWVFFIAMERSRFEADLLKARKESETLAANLAQANDKLEILHRALSDRAHTLELANFDLSKLSNTDPLTGLANRRALSHTIETWQLKNPAGQSASLLLIDVDHFKSVNDVHGHDEGDRILVLLANQLQLSIREADLAVRYGGEEFALWMPSANRDDAEQIAQRVHENIKHISVSDKPITVSIGAATATDMRGAELMHRLIEQADKAMYRAKVSGRNRTLHYSFPASTSIIYSKIRKP